MAVADYFRKITIHSEIKAICPITAKKIAFGTSSMLTTISMECKNYIQCTQKKIAISLIGLALCTNGKKKHKAGVLMDMPSNLRS